jgi:ATP-dependent DNA helicase RecG
VRDDGSIRGVDIGKETLRDWANRAAQATGVHPEIEIVSLEGKHIVRVAVVESAAKPVSCRGRYFRRVGSSNRHMSDDDITRAVLAKVGSAWDEVTEPRATLADIDVDRLRRFRALCNQNGRRIIPDDEDDATVLAKLNLIQEDGLSRAAVLLFGRDPQRFFPSAFLKIGRFRDSTLIVDDREVTGTLFDQVETALSYFREHLSTRFGFQGQAAREVVWQYPLEALREAVTNAVVHRDYMDAGDTQIRWHDEHLTILNPGVLIPPLTVDQLKQEHRSIPRNRRIAEMFFYAGGIERWGSGIQRMLDACMGAGLPEPSIAEQQGAFWLTFHADVLSEADLREQGLSERQIAAVLYVQERGRITNREYRQLTGLSDEGARQNLRILVDRGLLRSEGRGRGTHYLTAFHS